MSWQGYSDLKAWKEAMLLTKAVYVATKNFPKEEIYGLTQQVRRSAVSVPSNIAEGSERNSRREFAQFLGIASGSLAEVKTQLLIAADVFPTLAESLRDVLTQADEVGKILRGLRKKVIEDLKSEHRTPNTEYRISNNEERGTYV